MSMVIWCHDCSWVLMRAQSLMAPCSWLLLNSHEGSLLHGTKLMSVNGCSWELNGYQEHSWLLLAAYECSWGLMGAQEGSCLLFSSTHVKPWAKRHWAMSTHERSRTVMSMVPWGHGCSSAFMRAHGTIAPYSWVLVSAHTPTWVVMRIHERSWQVMRVEQFH